MGRNVKDITHICSVKTKFKIVLFIAYQSNALLNSTGNLFMGSYKQRPKTCTKDRDMLPKRQHHFAVVECGV